MLFDDPEIAQIELHLEWPEEVQPCGPELYDSAREEYSALAKNGEDWSTLIEVEGYLSRMLLEAEDAIDRLDGSSPLLEERIYELRLHCLVRRRVVRSILRSRIGLGRDTQSLLEELQHKRKSEMRERAIAYDKIKQLKTELKLARRDGRRIGGQELKTLMDQCRFKSSDAVNFAKLGRELGVHADTARARVREARLMSYAKSGG